MKTNYSLIAKLNDNSLESCVICYGHFTFLHAGHLRYLRQASKLRDKMLIVLSKGPLGDGSKTDLDERIDLIISTIGEVEVIYAENQTISKVIGKIKHDCILALGVEGIQNMGVDEAAVRSQLEAKNSELKIVEGTLGRSLEYLQRGTKEVIESHKNVFRQRCYGSNITLEKMHNALDQKQAPKVLLIGDIIVDEYVATEPLGISAEAPVIVVKELEAKKYLGGAGVVAKHLRSLGAEVTLISVIGNDSEADYVRNQLSINKINAIIELDSERPTTYKKRYISEQHKLFRVSRLSQASIKQNIRKEIKNKIKQTIELVDMVIISDFQYGVIDKELSDFIIYQAHKYEKRILVDMQCSTQSGRLTKYQNATVIFPTEKEARITAENWDLSLEGLGQKMIDLCKCEYCVLKLAEEGLILFQRDVDERFQLPALSVSAVDVAGAGDSLLSTVGYSLCQGLNIYEAIALGSTVASVCVENLGNEPVSNLQIKDRIKNVLS